LYTDDDSCQLDTGGSDDSDTSMVDADIMAATRSGALHDREAVSA